jgi:peptide/nickel transport system substrate-binding protein
VIGVPEANVTTPDGGLPQLARILSYEGLTNKNPDGHAEPRLAHSWALSPDGLKWDFNLRDSVTFHDGTPLDAGHVVRSLNASFARPGAVALRPALLDVKALTASGPRTVSIELRRPSSFLVDDMDVQIGAKGPPGKDSPGTGAFRIVSESRDEVVLESNEQFVLGKPNIKKIVIRPYETLRTAWAALMRGEIDMVSEVAQDAIEFVSNENVATYSFLRNYVYLIAFNAQRPQFRSPTVRRALNSAIDRDQLIGAVLKGHGIPANGPLWPRHWAYDASVAGYAYDPSLALSALRNAGIAGNSAPSHLSSGLRFTCLIPDGFAIFERLALTVQKQLYDAGVDMQIEAVPVDKYDVRIRNGEFDAVMIDMISGPTFARPYQFWRSPGELKGLNVFGYRNAEADKWFDALRHAANDTMVRAAAGQLQRVLRDDPPALFIAWNERTRAISRRFRVPSELGRDPLYTLRQWSLEPERQPTTH